MRVPFLSPRRDPYWGLDGRAARSGRRRRRFVGSIVIVLCATILALMLGRLASMDGAALLSGPRSLLLATSLAGEAVACCLVFAAESRRRQALREFGEMPGTLA